MLDVLKKIALSVFFGLVAALFFVMGGGFNRWMLQDPVRLACTGIGLVFAAVGVGVWFVKGPKRKTLKSLRASESGPPTYKIKSLDDKQTWFLVLGKRHVQVLDPSREVAVTIPRHWIEIAIRTPGFINGRNLQIVTEHWVPPEEDDSPVWQQVWADVRRIVLRRWNTEQWHQFEPNEALTREIDSYRSRSWGLISPEAAGAFRMLSKRQYATGGLALVVGLVIGAIGLAIGRMVSLERPHTVARIGAGGLIIAVIGLARILMAAWNSRKARLLEERPASPEQARGRLRRRRVVRTETEAEPDDEFSES